MTTVIQGGESPDFTEASIRPAPYPPSTGNGNGNGNGHGATNGNGATAYGVAQTAPRFDVYHGGRPERPWLKVDSRTGPGKHRAWPNRLLLLALIATFVAVGAYQVQSQWRDRDRIDVGAVTVAADPIDVGVTSPAYVVDILVRPGEQVEAGQPVATVDVVRPANAGGEQRLRTSLVAPEASTVLHVPARAGATLYPGQVVVYLYRPNELYLQAEVPADRLNELRVGMSGKVSGNGFDSSAVTLDEIEPVLTESAQSGTSHIVMRLQDASLLDGVIPGAQLKGWIDTASAPR